MRICFVSHSSGRGGAEEVLLETLECLRERNHECLVLMPGDQGLGTDLRKLGVPFRSLPYWCWMGHKSFLDRTQVAARNFLLSVPAALELRKWNPDLIYSNTMTVFFGAILAKILRRPHVWHLHEIGYEDHGLTFDFGSKISYKVINSASACIAVSKVTADAFAQHIDRSRLTVMFQSVHRQPRWSGTSVSPEMAVPPKQGKLRCIIVGRLSDGKRQEDAVLSMAELNRMGVDAELVVIGHSNPGYRKRLEALVKEHKLEDRVYLVGPVPDRLPYVESADVVLMCSRCEAFGRVTVEGMLAGKSVVAARSGANPELIQDGVSGLLYTVGNVRELAEKIRYLHENPSVAKSIGVNAKLWANAIFTKERFANELIPFLEGVVNRYGSGSMVLEDKGIVECK